LRLADQTRSNPTRFRRPVAAPSARPSISALLRVLHAWGEGRETARADARARGRLRSVSDDLVVVPPPADRVPPAPGTDRHAETVVLVRPSPGRGRHQAVPAG